MTRVKKKTVPFDKHFAVWDALDRVVQAWETLPGGRRYSPDEIGEWMRNELSPAINNARRALGRKIPDEDTAE
jgi:hypothetical protein